MSTEKKKTEVPLILQQNQRREKNATARPYQFGADTFERYSNSKNPFLERALQGEKTTTPLNPSKVQSLFQHLREKNQYQLAFPTERVAHYRRKITGHQVKNHQIPKFLQQKELKENTPKLEASIQTFFQHILARLRYNPHELSTIVNELVPLFLEFQIRIKVFDAFRTFYSVEQFLDTLAKISEGNDLENFDFFCSALFGFYSQLQ